MASIRKNLLAAAARLKGDEAVIEARTLLEHVLQRSSSWLYVHADDELAGADVHAFEQLLDARLRGEPVAYLTGSRGFWSLELVVTPDVLIPRADTELLVELALQRLAAEAVVEVADLGTGSGAIALAIASERPLSRVLATDRSDAALAVAEANAQRLSIGNVSFAAGDWLAALGDVRFAMIVSNPPYIAAADPHLQRGDLRFEPAAALASGADGLDDIRRIVADAPSHLDTGGWLLLEHGWDQGDAVREILARRGFSAVETRRDLGNRDRVSLGRWGGDFG